jgi:hypothetical protein
MEPSAEADVSSKSLVSKWDGGEGRARRLLATIDCCLGSFFLHDFNFQTSSLAFIFSAALSHCTSAFFSSFTMASASLEDRFEQITIHDDNNENGTTTSYHKSKVSAQTAAANIQLMVLGLSFGCHLNNRPRARQ